MKRPTCIFAVLCAAFIGAGCDSRTERLPAKNDTTKAGGDALAKAETPKDDGHVTINEVHYPVYPGATLLQDLKISVAYHVAAEPDVVQAWYDKQMVLKGWRSLAEWVDFGGQFQKDFLSGEPTRNPRFAEKMVKIAVAPHEKKGGSHLMILPIANKYRSRKQP